MRPEQPENILDLMQTFCADDAPPFVPSTEGDDLEEFLEWYVANPRHAAIPFHHGFTFDQGVCGFVLFRQPPYQVQMFIVAPGYDVPEHRHPNVDSFEVYLGGHLEMRLAGHVVVNPDEASVCAPNGLSHARGCVLRLRPRDWHGGKAGASGGAFLSVQKWLNGLDPTSVGDDWMGPRAQTREEGVRRPSTAAPVLQGTPAC